MNSRFTLATLLAVAAAFLSSVGAQDKPPNKFGEIPSVVSKNLQPAGSIQGQLIRVSESGRFLTIRYNVKVARPNPQDPRMPVIVEDKPEETELMIVDDVKVRLPAPPPEIDPKTNRPKPPPKPDPKDPDSKLPGIKGDPKVLPEMVPSDVVVVLGRDRSKPPKTYITTILITRPPMRPAP